MRVETGKKIYCRSCQTHTSEVFEDFQDHIANICPECNSRRIGKPYISRKKFNKIKSFLPIRGLSNDQQPATIH